jgi:hypothetical protein
VADGDADVVEPMEEALAGLGTHLVSPAVAAATAIAGTFATPADLD